jgi:ABC-type antimicrobial peptide transport system permease subunit
MNPQQSSGSATIPDQVKLPISIVWEIVVQGIRIRLGRSIVTMLGVVLGVAFLMSILTAYLIRKQVTGEIETRQSLDAMAGFLKVEAGAPAGKTFAIYKSSTPTLLEERFLELLRREGAKGFVDFENAKPAADGKVADALIVLGDSLPAALWKSQGAQLAKLVAAFTRMPVGDHSGVPVVVLQRPPDQEEIQKQAREAKTDQVRTIWIMCIAVLVTMISISNALLMSVTERFKEIGTMKCLGALSSFIRRVFFVESAVVGFVGSISGAVFGLLFALVLYGFSFGWWLVFSSFPWIGISLSFAACIAGGITASILAAIYPASFASRMVPATALRTNI